MSGAGEISWEIDTDKSSTLRLPGRLRWAEEASPANGRGFLENAACSAARELTRRVGYSGGDKKGRCAPTFHLTNVFTAGIMNRAMEMSVINLSCSS